MRAKRHYKSSGTGAAPASVELSVRAEARPEGTVVTLDIKPRRFLGVQIEEMSLEMPLG